MATFTNQMDETQYEEYLAFRTANECHECGRTDDLRRNDGTRTWVCESCNAELNAGFEAEAEAEAAELAATMPDGREFVAGAGCQNCGAGGRLYEISETLESFMVCDTCAGEFEPAAAPAIARKMPARAVAACGLGEVA